MALLAIAPDDADRETDREIEQLFRDAQFLANRFELDKALLLYGSILKRSPDSPRALVYHGLTLVQLDRADEAAADFEKAVSINPNYGLGYFGRGWVRGEQGDAQGALEDAERGLELNPANAHLYYRAMGAALDRMKRHAEAQANYSRAIELIPELRGPYLDRALSYESTGQLDLALADLNRAIELDPEWPWALTARGRIQIKQGNAALALTDFALAIRFKPDYAEPYRDRATLYEALGDTEKAIADYESGIPLEHSSEMVAQIRARLKKLKKQRK